MNCNRWANSASGDAGEKGRHHERQELHPASVDAHQFAGDLVLADRQHPAPVLGIDEVAHHPDRHHHPEKHPGQRGQFLDARNAARAADVINVLDHRLDDHQKRQGDDRQIVAAHLERRHRHDQPQQRRRQPAGQHRQRKQPRIRRHRQHLLGQQGGGVGPHRHETGVGQGKLAHVAVHQVQADGQDDIDPDVHHHQLDVLVEQVVFGDGESQDEPDGNQHRQQPALGHQPFPASVARLVHTFCILGWPRMP